MSTLTIRLDEIQDRELTELKEILGHATSSTCIKFLIKNYKFMREEKARLEMELFKLDKQSDRLREAGQEYFDSMHELMRACEFQQKI